MRFPKESEFFPFRVDPLNPGPADPIYVLPL